MLCKNVRVMCFSAVVVQVGRVKDIISLSGSFLVKQQSVCKSSWLVFPQRCLNPPNVQHSNQELLSYCRFKAGFCISSRNKILKMILDLITYQIKKTVKWKSANGFQLAISVPLCLSFPQDQFWLKSSAFEHLADVSPHCAKSFTSTSISLHFSGASRHWGHSDRLVRRPVESAAAVEAGPRLHAVLQLHHEKRSWWCPSSVLFTRWSCRTLKHLIEKQIW